eukprot:1160813-Pelagomonas_calceolata.AAC.10
MDQAERLHCKTQSTPCTAARAEQSVSAHAPAPRTAALPVQAQRHHLISTLCTTHCALKTCTQDACTCSTSPARMMHAPARPAQAPHAAVGSGALPRLEGGEGDAGVLAALKPVHSGGVNGDLECRGGRGTAAGRVERCLTSRTWSLTGQFLPYSIPGVGAP